MNQIAIRVKGRQEKKFTMPSAWEDVPEQAWQKLGPVIIAGDTARSRISLIRALMKDQNGHAIRTATLKKLRPYQIIALADLLAWVWKKNLTVRPFHSFLHEGIEYHLPDEGLKNVSLIEYAYVDFCYNILVKQAEAGNTEGAAFYFNQVVGYLCRPLDLEIDITDPKTYKGDRRETFNTLICDARMDSIARLPESTKLAVFLFFVGCKREIHKDYMDSVFSRDRDDKGRKIISSARPMQPQEWIDICFRLAGSKFGTLEETMNTNLFTILHYMSMQEK